MNMTYDLENDVLVLTCPQCSTTYERELRKISWANFLAEGIKCIDCECEFTVGVVLLDPRGLTLREPVAPIREAVSNSTDEAIPGVVDDIEELWS